MNNAPSFLPLTPVAKTICNDAITVSRDEKGSITVEHGLYINCESLCKEDVINKWNAGIDMLTAVIKNMFKINNFTDVQRDINEIVYWSTSELAKKHYHAETDFKAFELGAKSGEFNFGSNCYGHYDVETQTVDFDSHGEENFEYKSLRDFYNHYVLEMPVAYRYCALIGNNDEESGVVTFHDPDDAKKLAGVDIELDGSDIFSDLVDIDAEFGYSQRQSKVIIKGIDLSSD